MADHKFIFGGADSSTYGIYISGEGVFNAPERAVEMISIPGRNGAIALDQGRFENIEVTYPAFNYEQGMSDFSSNLAGLRSALCSKSGYQRLTDTIHPDEFRLGVYRSGLEVTPVKYNTASDFNITFDCKPQRFLTSGETEVDGNAWSNVQTGSGSIVTIDNADGETGIKSLVANIEPIQSGTGTPSPTNIRPISGRTEVKTYVSEDNLISARENWYANANGVVEAAAFYGAVVFPVQQGETYSLLIEQNTNPNRVLAFYEEYPQVGSVSYNRSRVTSAPTTLTAPINGWCLYRDVVANTIQSVVKGSTAQSAEEAKVYTTDLGRTVYKGTLDVVSGLLRVTYARADIGELNWTYNSASAIYLVQIPDRQIGNTGIVCDTYPLSEQTSTATQEDFTIRGRVATDTTTYIKDSRFTSAADFKTALAGHYFIYELATPLTYQLTPEEVDLLLGTNNIWADSGDITVQYGKSPVYNPTEFDARPLIKVTGTGTAVVGDTVITITGTAGQTIYIDCDSMEIYTLNGGIPQSAASLVSFSGNDFPKLKAGNNSVSLGSGISSLKITPRWWII